MTHTFRLSATLSSITMLSACGGSDTGLQSFQSRYAQDVTAATAVYATPNTIPRYVPTSGSAVFNGAGALLIDPVEATDSDDIVVLGDARMVANFSSSTITGSITNMEAITNPVFQDGNFISGNVSDAPGQINIGLEESVVGDDFDDNRTNNDNEWYADYQGNVAVEGDNIFVEGALFGTFVGTRVNPAEGQSPIRGIVGESLDGSYSLVNGNEVGGFLEVYGRN